MRTSVFALSTVVMMSLACAGDPGVAANPSPGDYDPAVVAPVSPALEPDPAPVDVPYYYTRAITASDLADTSLRERALMRNTISARAGNPFRKKWLNDYFSEQPWYVARDKMDSTKLSAHDLANAQTIGTYEATLPPREARRTRWPGACPGRSSPIFRAATCGSSATRSSRGAVGRSNPSNCKPTSHRRSGTSPILATPMIA